MLTIRFFRTGKKNQPAFKIVVTDKRRPPSAGRFVEQVGFYNPLTKEKNLNIEQIKYWLSVGAKASPRVHNILVSEKVVDAKKVDVHKKPKKSAEEEPAEVPVAEVSPPSVETPEKPEEETKTEEAEAKTQ